MKLYQLLFAGCALAVSTPDVYADPAPSFLLQWGTRGSGDGQFQNPGGIAVGPNRVYVADRGNHRIQIFDLNGQFVGKWSCGSCDVFDLAIEPSGNLLMTDHNPFPGFSAGRLLEVGGDGTYLRTIGVQGPGPGQIDRPMGVDVDGGGNIHVVNDGPDYNYDRYAADGTLAGTWPIYTRYGSRAPGLACAATSNGDVFVSYWFLGSPADIGISKRTASGAFVPSFAPPDFPGLVYGLAADAAGNLYVGGNQRIVKLDGTTGAIMTEWGSAGSGPGQFNNPERVALDALGNVYVVDAGNNRIQKFGSGATGIHRTSWGTLKSIYR